MSRHLLGAAALAATLGVTVSATPPAQAAGETNYDPLYCGGPNGAPEPTFSPATDLPVLLQRIGQITANPALLFGPADRFTNWYSAPDMRTGLATLPRGPGGWGPCSGKPKFPSRVSARGNRRKSS